MIGKTLRIQAHLSLTLSAHYLFFLPPPHLYHPLLSAASWALLAWCGCLGQCFAVRSLGWVEIPEEELTPGKSSLAVNNCIQQLSSSKAEGRDALGAWGEVRGSNGGW